MPCAVMEEAAIAEEGSRRGVCGDCGSCYSLGLEMPRASDEGGGKPMGE